MTTFRAWGILTSMAVTGIALMFWTNLHKPLKASDSLAKALKQESFENPQQVYLVNLWALWCEPCKEEIPDLVRLASHEKKLQLRLLQMEPQEKWQEGRTWLQSVQAAPYHLEKKGFENFFEELGIDHPSALPFTILLQNGQILQFWAGSKSFSELKLELQPYFE